MVKVEDLSATKISIITELWEKYEKKKKSDTLSIMRDISYAIFKEENVDLPGSTWQSYCKTLENSGCTGINGIDSFTSYAEELLTNSSGGNKLIIKFPEVKITDGSHKPHLIQDLYVRIGVTGTRNLFSGALEGARGKFTMAEYQFGYHHSHLGHSRGVTWQQFCTGSGPINLNIGALKEKFTKEEFQMFCYNLQNYVKWESIEGTPFVRYAQIESGASGYTGGQMEAAHNIDRSVVTSVVDKLYPAVLRTNFKKHVRFGINSKGVTIQNIDLDKAMVDIITKIKLPPSSQYRLENHLLCEKYHGTPIHRIDGVNSGMLRKPDHRNSLGEFKGTTIIQEVTDWDEYTKQSPTKKEQLYVHPQITEETINRIKNNFSKTALKVRRLSPKSPA
jgi:hypothetical protein